MKKRFHPVSAWDVYNREKRYNTRKRREDKASGKLISLEQALEEWKKVGNRSRKLALAEISVNWERIVGQNIAAHAKIVEIQRGVLILSVEDSNWRHQLFFMRNTIINKINSELGENLIKEIILRG